MSTHSAIGVKHADGKITGCYVHYDGYPRHMMPALKDYISKFTTTGLFSLIIEAQKRGGIRSFHSPDPAGDTAEDGIGHCDPYTTFAEDPEPYHIDETNFYDDHMGTFAWYLVDYKTGEIEKKERWPDG